MDFEDFTEGANQKASTTPASSTVITKSSTIRERV